MDRPALHVVVHHRFDPEKPYQNSWDDDCLCLRQFETTNAVASACAVAKDQDAWIYVHRCGLPPIAPTIACRGKIREIRDASGKRPLVLLESLEVIDGGALQKPGAGHNHYYADVPSWSR